MGKSFSTKGLITWKLGESVGGIALKKTVNIALSWIILKVPLGDSKINDQGFYIVICKKINTRSKKEYATKMIKKTVYLSLIDDLIVYDHN